ncbi:MAG: glycosyltransferase family 2 protein [Acidobacteria bacterium]|nr:MAG: glycosyltransferase family 2 protein [Acidobacteriota bacterium]
MAAHEDVLAICVNWNGGNVLRPAVQALLASRYQPVHLVVVDNASTDDSLEDLQPGIEIVRLKQNLGYGAAINHVWREVQAGKRPRPAYYLLLNNDLFADPDMLTQMISFASGKEPGIYGPKILQWHHPDRLDMAWGNLRWHHVLADFEGKESRDGPQWNQLREVDVLQGSVLLMDAAVPESVGLFDESFFMYHEELDFLYRARRQGCRAYYCPFAKALHWGAHGTQSQPLQKVFWTRRNAVYFMRKHRPGTARWPYFLLTLGGSILYNLLTLKGERAKAIISGAKAGFRMPVREGRI